MCSSSVSPSAITPAAPPSADTVWLRIGYTLDTTATSSRGFVWAIAMAARKPAPPPPARSTSCVAATGLSLTPQLLVDQHRTTVVHDEAVDAAVVVLLAAGLAAAGEPHILSD